MMAQVVCLCVYYCEWACVCVCVCAAAGGNEGVMSACVSAGLCDVIVDVLRHSPDESPVRKNAAVVVAKLAKYPPVCVFASVRRAMVVSA